MLLGLRSRWPKNQQLSSPPPTGGYTGDFPPREGIPHVERVVPVLSPGMGSLVSLEGFTEVVKALERKKKLTPEQEEALLTILLADELSS